MSKTFFKSNTAELSDEEKQEGLLGIAQELQILFLEKISDKIQTAIALNQLEEQICVKRNAFIAKAYTWCGKPAFQKVAHRQTEWSSFSTLPLEDAFEDEFFAAILNTLETYVFSRRKLDGYNFPGIIVQKTDYLMIDQFRRIARVVMQNENEDKWAADPASMAGAYSLESDLDTQSLQKAWIHRFRQILPNQYDRVFLRWFWLYKPGDDQIATVFDIGKGYVKVHRARLMQRLIKAMKQLQMDATQVEVFKILDEIPSDDDARDGAQEAPVTAIVDRQLSDLLVKSGDEKAKKYFRELFKKQLEKWVLLRWNWLLQPSTIQQAIVYEFSNHQAVINLRWKTTRQVIHFLNQKQVLKP